MRIRNLLPVVLLSLAASAAAGEAANCPGDCDGDGRISVAELIRGVRCALRLNPLPGETCEPCFPSPVSIQNLVRAVSSALSGCPAVAPTATPTPQPACSFAVEPDYLWYQGCGRDGGSFAGEFSVFSSSEDCCWEIREFSAQYYYLELTSAAAGCGDGVVTYRIDPNNMGERGGSFLVVDDEGGVRATHSFHQASHCTPTVTPRFAATATPPASPTAEVATLLGAWMKLIPFRQCEIGLPIPSLLRLIRSQSIPSEFLPEGVEVLDERVEVVGPVVCAACSCPAPGSPIFFALVDEGDVATMRDAGWRVAG